MVGSIVIRERDAACIKKNHKKLQQKYCRRLNDVTYVYTCKKNLSISIKSKKPRPERERGD